MRSLLHPSIPVESQTQEHVVLQQYLCARTGEVQCESRHFAAEITHLENKAFRQVSGFAPYDPSQTGVDQTVLMTGGADGVDALDAEVPCEVRLDEWCDHTSRSAVHMDAHIKSGALLDAVQCFADLFDRLIHTRIGHAHDGHHADGVLIDILVEIMAVEHFVVLGNRHIAWFHVEIVAELLPAHLHGAAHHQIRMIGRQVGLFAGFLPTALQRESAQHASFRRADGGGSDGIHWIGCMP